MSESRPKPQSNAKAGVSDTGDDYDPARNNTNFPLATYRRLKNLKFTPNDLELYHQHVARSFLRGAPRQRGILMYHGTGFGKTRLGALVLRDEMQHRRVVVVAPTAVFPRFRDEFQKTGVDTNSVRFVSLRANNLATQIDRLSDDPFAGANALRDTPLDNTVVVVDEAHALFVAITNGSQNAVHLHDSIMAARNVKLVLQTATPIVNHPFELVPCFNLLAGKKLFPESLEDFEKYFITPDGRHAMNLDVFKNRIVGLVSYFGDWMSAATRLHRPKRLPTQIVRVPMTVAQYAIYSTYRDKEREESSFPVRGRAERYSPKAGVSSYRIRSRMASNLVPLDAPSDRDIEASVKFAKAHEITDRYPDSPGTFYSNFVNKCGGRAFGRYLELRGWTAWDPEEPARVRTKRETPGCFVVLAGDTPDDERVAIQRAASLPENRTGRIIRLVILGPAASEGIEFHAFRYCIICDPHFNAIRNIQVEARIDRYKSHEALPAAQRTVQTFVLLADYPDEIREQRAEYIKRLAKQESNADADGAKTAKQKPKKTSKARKTKTGGDELDRGGEWLADRESDAAAENEPNPDAAAERKAETASETRAAPGTRGRKKQPNIVYVKRGDQDVAIPLEDTTDIYMYRKSKQRQILALEFQRAMIEASVDCAVHRDNLPKERGANIHCMMCAPTDTPLFSDRLDRDVTQPNPCRAPETETVEAKEIIVQDAATGEQRIYMYSINTVDGSTQLFEFDDELDGYVPVKRDNPVYADVMDEISRAASAKK